MRFGTLGRVRFSSQSAHVGTCQCALEGLPRGAVRYHRQRLDDVDEPRVSSCTVWTKRAKLHKMLADEAELELGFSFFGAPLAHVVALLGLAVWVLVRVPQGMENFSSDSLGLSVRVPGLEVQTGVPELRIRPRGPQNFPQWCGQFKGVLRHGMPRGDRQGFLHSLVLPITDCVRQLAERLSFRDAKIQ